MTPSNTPVHYLMLLAKSAYNKTLVVSYTTHAQSTLPFSWRYLLLPHNKYTNWKNPRACEPISQLHMDTPRCKNQILNFQHDPSVSSSAQARDAAHREEEEECADHTWEKWLFERRKKGLYSSIKMDFIRLRNGSTNDAHGACFKIMICIQELSPR
jgi:hypothetical protein